MGTDADAVVDANLKVKGVTGLRNLGAPTIVSDLPGVGQNLREEIIFKGTWSTKQPIMNQPSNIGYAIVWANMDQFQQAQSCCEMMRGNYVCDESEKELESHYSITGGAMRP